MVSFKILLLMALTAAPTYSASVGKFERNVLQDSNNIVIPQLEVSEVNEKKYVIKETNIPLSALAILTEDPHLTYIGDYGDRSYFENQYWMNWYEAKSYCENMGTELAELTSVDLWYFIYNRIEPGTIYWTAAKDSGNRDQFLSYGRNTDVKLTYLHSRIIRHETCVGVHGSIRSMWEIDECIQQRFALCQSLKKSQP